MLKIDEIRKAIEMEQQEAEWVCDMLELIKKLLNKSEEALKEPLPECLQQDLFSLYTDLRENIIRKHFTIYYEIHPKPVKGGMKVQQGAIKFEPKTKEAKTLLGLHEVILYQFGYIKKEDLKYSDPDKGFGYIDPNE